MSVFLQVFFAQMIQVICWRFKSLESEDHILTYFILRTCTSMLAECLAE